MRNTTFALLLASAMALSGCMGVGTGITADASLEYDGASNGSHSETTDCGDSGTLSGSGNVPDGTVQITLTDGNDGQLFQQSYDGDFTLESQEFTGDSGTWKIDAQRSGDDLAGDEFRGDYGFHLDC